eukprot:395394_1
MSHGIYKYDISKDTFTKMMSFGASFECAAHDAAYDCDNQLIYTASQSGLCTFDLKRQLFHKIAEIDEFGPFPSMINTKDNVHITGSDGRTFVSKHFIFNKNSKQVTENHSFEESLWGHAMIQISNKSIVIINKRSPSWYEYLLNDNKWIKSDINPSIKHAEFSVIVKSNNGQYIIFLGGQLNSLDSTNAIYVYDVIGKCMSISSVKCPEENKLYKGIIVCNEKADDLLTSGYIKECFNASQFENVQLLPRYIVKLIRQWISNEKVHLFSETFTIYSSCSGSAHWKIQLDAILESCLSG